MAISGSDLFAGGTFTTATNTGGSTVTVNRIARWNGSAWSALDVGMNDTVSALSCSGGNLFAGGAFTTAGLNPAYNIARWNGTAWSAVGEGVNGTVNALASLGSDVYAAGAFTTATNSGSIAVTATRIAKWNGSTWSPLSSGLDSTANALAVSGTTLYAGGFFNNAGGVPVGRIAQWNGASWSVIGSATNNIFVMALAVSGSDLYVGGTFSTVGPVSANNIAKWDGSNWTTLGSGISGTSIAAVNALAVAAGNLYVGGSFTKAGDKPTSYIAKATIGTAVAPGRFSALTYSPIGGFSCTFLDASMGQPYRIQTSPTLATGSWTDVSNFSYASPITLTLPLGAPANRFVRAVTP
jgi:hypothetical protein